jgi:hypothetical protein
LELTVQIACLSLLFQLDHLDSMTQSMVFIVKAHVGK